MGMDVMKKKVKTVYGSSITKMNEELYMDDRWRDFDGLAHLL